MNDGFVRADQIDLKTIDEQLEKHFNKVNDDSSHDHSNSIATTGGNNMEQREEWEIDPSNLIIKSVLARGTFGTVHRGFYDGQDVAGNFHKFLFKISFFYLFHVSIFLHSLLKPTKPPNSSLLCKTLYNSSMIL